jgi:hypothetical protein
VKQQLPSRGGGQYAGRQGTYALAGLTLLACGVPADDRVVQGAAAAVRAGADRETRTYDLALSVLFLDRLGDAQDRELIRTCAMRLVASQNAAGGWDYDCPQVQMVQGQLRDQLIEALRVLNSTDRNRLPKDLKKLAVLRYWPGDRLGGSGRDDNSNTQFALLAVWAARKYDLPVDRTLMMVEARFRLSQNSNGTWGYLLREGQHPDSMTCAGLVGLAVGRGVKRDSQDHKNPAQDADVARALRYLGDRIGTLSANNPPGRGRAGRVVGADAHGDLYFLWSVERVAVIYDLKRIEGKDWYAWGARALVEHQQDDGSWQDTFAGLPDTCFALLFLKRVNVAQDLTTTLRSTGGNPDQRTGSRDEQRTKGGEQRTTTGGDQRTTTGEQRTTPGEQRTKDETPGRVRPK